MAGIDEIIRGRRHLLDPGSEGLVTLQVSVVLGCVVDETPLEQVRMVLDFSTLAT